MLKHTDATVHCSKCWWLELSSSMWWKQVWLLLPIYNLYSINNIILLQWWLTSVSLVCWGHPQTSPVQSILFIDFNLIFDGFNPFFFFINPSIFNLPQYSHFCNTQVFCNPQQTSSVLNEVIMEFSQIGRCLSITHQWQCYITFILIKGLVLVQIKSMGELKHSYLMICVPDNWGANQI